MRIDRKYMLDLFLDYVSYDTQADAEAGVVPSSPIQIELAKVVAKECEKIGMVDVKVHPSGYATAVLKSNIDKNVPAIGFLAHLDTACEASGKDIKPRIIENYDGKDITLDSGRVMYTSEFPRLAMHKGATVVVTDGTTLLGGDDKAGVAEILAAMKYLIEHPEIKHGEIKVAFTPDEEIGTGMNSFDAKEFGVEFAYTIDGGPESVFNYETFNACGSKIKITGKSVHTGSAKGILINAGLIAAEIAMMFPIEETPQNTENYEGFYHLGTIEGGVEEAVVKHIIRDHDKEKFFAKKAFVENVVKQINEKYGNVAELEMKDSYMNMAEKVNENKAIVEYALKAYKNIGIEPVVIPIRGGTDGARLSFMGIPCPNIFYGGDNAHGPYEYVVVESMAKAAEVILEIAQLVCE